MVVTAGGYVAGRIHRVLDPPMEKTDYLPSGGGSGVKPHESRATGKE